MGAGEDFAEFARKMDELAEFFGEEATGRISGSGMKDGKFISPDGWEPKKRIANGVSRAMTESGGIVDQAKAGADPYVTEGAKQSIQYRQDAWNAHRLIATDDLIKYHEFGTSTKATDQSEATINAPDGNGYIIPQDGYDSLPFGPDTLPDSLDFQFVVHPGVEAQHFMRDALLNNTKLIEERVADELDDVRIDI